MLIANKQIVLDAFMRMAKSNYVGMDKDYILIKLQGLMLQGDLTQEEVQPIVDVLVPPVEVEAKE